MPKKTDQVEETEVKSKKATKVAKEEVTEEKAAKKTTKKVEEEPKAPAKAKKDAKVKPTASVGIINVAGKAGELIKKYQRTQEDTGSTEVQIALFTAKIDQLSKHLKKHNKDSDSKRGLLIMVGKRRRLLTFLQKNDQKAYENLIADLGLRK